MKTTRILNLFLLINSVTLLASLSSVVNLGPGLWVFGILEVVLWLVRAVNRWLTNLGKDFMINVGYLDAAQCRDAS